MQKRPTQKLLKVNLSQVQSCVQLHYQREGQPDQRDDHHLHRHHLEGKAHFHFDFHHSNSVPESSILYIRDIRQLSLWIDNLWLKDQQTEDKTFLNA